MYGVYACVWMCVYDVNVMCQPQALLELESNADIKPTLREIIFSGAKKIDAASKKAICILFVPVPQQKTFQKIQVGEGNRLQWQLIAKFPKKKETACLVRVVSSPDPTLSPHPLTKKRVWWLLSASLVVLSQQSRFLNKWKLTSLWCNAISLASFNACMMSGQETSLVMAVVSLVPRPHP